MCWCIRRENFIETHSQTIKISIGDNTWPQKPFLGSTVKDVVLPGSTKISDPGSRVRLAESPAYMCRPLEVATLRVAVLATIDTAGLATADTAELSKLGAAGLGAAGLATLRASGLATADTAELATADLAGLAMLGAAVLAMEDSAVLAMADSAMLSMHLWRGWPWQTQRGWLQVWRRERGAEMAEIQ